MELPHKVAVLGSNAFTSGHFIDHLLRETPAEVLGVSRSPEYDPVFLPFLYRQPRPARYRFHQLDMNRDLEAIMRLLDQFEPDVVVNYASQGEVRNSWRWPEQWYQTNCVGVVRLAEQLRTRPYLKRYVSISTPEVYGASAGRVKENQTYDPSTPYAAAKLAGDLHLQCLFKRHGFPVVYTRAANLYGIHQQLYRIIPRAVIYVKLGRTIQLHGEGKARRAFIHARDVADLTWRAICNGRAGEVYHCAPDDGLRSIAEVVRLVCERMGRDFETCTERIPENFGQDACFDLDATKARTELAWRPAVDFAEGVQDVIDWIESNWDFIRSQPLEYVHKE